MSFNVAVLSSVFDNPDLLREIGLFVEPRLPMHFVFHSAREAFSPLEEKDENGGMVIKSVKWKFFCSFSMVEWVQQQKRLMNDFSNIDKLGEYAVRTGCLDIVKKILFKKSRKSIQNACSLLLHASRYGRIDVLNFISSKFPQISSVYQFRYKNIDLCCCCGASRCGSREAIKVLRSMNPPFQLCYMCPTSAIKGGNLELLQLFLLDQSFRLPIRTCSWTAAEEGHTHILEWLSTLYSPIIWGETALSAAACKGHLHILQWLRPQLSPFYWKANLCRIAAEKENLPMLQWLRAQDPPCPWDEEVCLAAVNKGNLEILQWLRSQLPPCPFDTVACRDAAVREDNVDVLIWIKTHDPNVPLGPSVLRSAIADRRGRVVRWLRSISAPVWNVSDYLNAIANNDLQMIQFLRAQDPPCPWTQEVCTAAARLGKLGILKWLRSQDPPCPWSEMTCTAAAQRDDMKVIKWLRAQDPPCPWSEAISRYVRNKIPNL